MSIEIIDLLKPKNGGNFPIAEASDIAVSSDKRLPEALAEKASIADVASKANASDVTTSVNNLQGQIDQIIITASAEEIVAPEVAAARVDADGVSYTTLKGRIDSDSNRISDISESDETTTEVPVADRTVTSDYFKAFTDGHDSGPYAGEWRYETVAVEGGEEYSVTAYAGSNARLWILLDSNDDVISYSVDSSEVSLKTETVIIAANASKLVVNERTHIIDELNAVHIKSVLRNNFVKGSKVKINDISLPVILENQETEVQNACVGTDGTNYDSLKERLDTENLSISEPVNDVIQSVDNYIEVPSEDRTKTESYYRFFYDNQDKGPYVDEWQYESIIVTPNEEYQISAYAGQNARLWIVYDENNNRLAYSLDNTETSLKTETVVIPADGATLIVNERTHTADEERSIHIKKKYSNYAIDGEKVSIEGTALPEYLDNINSQKGVLYGKTLVCCGDSITFGADMDQEGYTDNPNIDVYARSGSSWIQKTDNVRMAYGYQIASRNAMKYYCDGISGSTMQGLSDYNGFSLENGRYTTLPNDIDYLTIFFGWNDTAYGTLGTISDSTNGSYYGGYNTVIPYLQNKYPYAKICLVVPFGCDAAHRNAIRQLCNKWGLACFDMYGAGTPLYYGKEDSVGVDPDVVTANRAKFQANGAHPSYKGHKQIADMLENFLRGI